jgi:hypothetical protein
MCRARLQKNEVLQPNIYAAAMQEQGATIAYTVGTENKSHAWKVKEATDPVLTAVSVFDSMTASVHVDQTNELAYTPMPLRILADLAQACQDLKAKLTAELNELDKQTPDLIKAPTCSAHTAVGKLIKGLNAKSKPETVETLATLSDAENARLNALDNDLTSDPARTARLLKARIDKIGELMVTVENLSKGTDAIALSDLRGKYDAHQAAKAAALAA